MQRVLFVLLSLCALVAADERPRSNDVVCPPLQSRTEALGPSDPFGPGRPFVIRSFVIFPAAQATLFRPFDSASLPHLPFPQPEENQAQYPA